jgi:hypothetical protein
MLAPRAWPVIDLVAEMNPNPTGVFHSSPLIDPPGPDRHIAFSTRTRNAAGIPPLRAEAERGSRTSPMSEPSPKRASARKPLPTQARFP